MHDLPVHRSDSGPLNRVTRWFCSLFLFSLLLGQISVAQGHRASVRGRVMDKSGAAIPGARLLLVREGTGESRSALSGSEGEFILVMLQSASYRFEVEHSGYKKQVIRFDLSVNQELRLTVHLEI